MRNILTQTLSVCGAVCALAFVTGCESTNSGSTQSTAKPAAPAPAPTAPAVAPAAPAPTAAKAVIRVNAGAGASFTDSSGNVWQPDQGFADGDVIERDPSTAIANTKDAALYLSEHYAMSSFSVAVPNGKYVAKLHFAETFEGISGPGQRVFSFSVHGRELKDFDVWVKAGGPNKAYIETVPVEVTNGKFTITFTSNIENPEINAIELAPQP
jgi:hypothetical protein